MGYWLWGTLLILLGLIVVTVSLFVAGRSRGKKRCPTRGCWFSLEGVASTGGVVICPECGKSHKPKSLFRTRRYWRLAIGGGGIFFLGVAIWAYFIFSSPRWYAAAPSVVLIAGLETDLIAEEQVGGVLDQLRCRARNGQLWRFDSWCFKNCLINSSASRHGYWHTLPILLDVYIHDPDVQKYLLDTMNKEDGLPALMIASGMAHARIESVRPHIREMLERKPGWWTPGLLVSFGAVADSEDVHVLLGFLENRETRLAAMLAVGISGTKSKTALPILEVWRDYRGETLEQRIAASVAADCVSGESPNMATSLLFWILSDSEAERQVALRLLEQLGPEGHEILSHTSGLLCHQSDDIKYCGIQVLFLFPDELEKYRGLVEEIGRTASDPKLKKAASDFLQQLQSRSAAGNLCY